MNIMKLTVASKVVGAPLSESFQSTSNTTSMKIRLVYLYFALLCFIRATNGKISLTAVKSLSTFNNRMIPHLLQALSYDRENVVYSPFGLTTSLAVILEGVDNKIGEEFCQILKLGSPNSVRENLRDGFETFSQILKRKSKGDYSVGSYNRITVNSSKPLIPQFSSVLSNFYNIQIENNIKNGSTQLHLDLRTDTGVMSHWKDYDKLAVYTYLSHQHMPFMTHQGDVLNVPMIPQVGLIKAGYHPNLSSQIVRLPLEDESGDLVLIMPDNKDGISDLLIRLLKADLSALTNDLPTIEAEVYMPQFAQISSDLNLGKVIKKSGLGILFKQSRGGPLRTIKQNSYIATSFVSINSVTSTDTLLYKKLKVKTSKKKLEIEEPAIEEVIQTTTKAAETTVKEDETVTTTEIEEENSTESETTEENVTEVEQTEKRRKRETTDESFIFNKPFIFLVYQKLSNIVLTAGVVRKPNQTP